MTHVSRWRAACLSLGLASAAPAFAAQADGPTLFGVVDLGLAGFHDRERSSSHNMQSGMQSGSRWGLRGREDLGDGLYARYHLESGVLATTGRSAQGGRLFGRGAWLGVGGAWGELRAGRQTSVSSERLGEFDPFLASYLNLGAQTALLPFNANRADNTLAWRLPMPGPWRVAVDHSFDATGGGGFATNSANRLDSAALGYDDGTSAVALTYEGGRWAADTAEGRAMAAAGGAEQPWAVSLAGRRKIGPATLYLAYSHMRHGSTLPAAPSPGQTPYFPGGTVHGLLAGLGWQVGAGTIMASWQSSIPEHEGALARQGATHAQHIASVGYSHDLSRRTNVYAILGQLRGAWEDAGWRQTQYAVGLRHRF
ncbi:outer membrane porin protein [Bordetella ansorpii]|uniref:Outer membrane porin protein n=1 Tax=Bordetella ansorpii TaxID=288768 RepID=A0A157SM50_9BORD|nr:porin [Bordetella ansorpii]SAI70966.1 outer membrane porin protein [Bordetella ansorpii]